MARSAVDIASELARLEGLAILELRQEWRRLHQTPPPMRLSRDILLRGIAYKLQERVLGGLSKSTLRKLQSSDPDGLSMPQGRRSSASFRQWLTMPPEEVRALARQMIARVTLSADLIEVAVGTGKLARALGAVSLENETGQTIVLSIAAKLRRVGRGKRLVIGEQSRAEINLDLVRLMQEAVAARTELLADTTKSINVITARLGKSKGRMTSLMRLSYLAPHIVDAILAGRQPVGLSVKSLLQLSRDLPLDWSRQGEFLRFV